MTDDAPTTEPTEPDTAAQQDDGKQETDWQAEARKWERQSKANLAKVKELQPLAMKFQATEEAAKTEAQKAHDALAAAEAKTTALLHRTARAEIRSALPDEVKGLADDIDVSKYVGADGELDQDAVKGLVEKFSGIGKPRPAKPDFTQGSGGNGNAASSPGEQFASFIKSQMG